MRRILAQPARGIIGQVRMGAAVMHHVNAPGLISIVIGLDRGVYARNMSVYAPIVKRNLSMPFESSARLQECNCLALRQAARHVTQFYDQYLASTGLRTTQFSILAKLRRLGPMTINRLAAEMV